MDQPPQSPEELTKPQPREKPPEIESARAEPSRSEHPESLRSALPKQPAQTCASPPMVMAPSPATVPGVLLVGGQTVESSSNPRRLYEHFVEYTFRSHWKRSNNLLDLDYVAEVKVGIDGVGLITGHEWMKGSGNPRWDNSVRQALEETRSVSRPPPQGFPQTVLVRFDIQVETDAQTMKRGLRHAHGLLHCSFSELHITPPRIINNPEMTKVHYRATLLAVKSTDPKRASFCAANLYRVFQFSEMFLEKQTVATLSQQLGYSRGIMLPPELVDLMKVFLGGRAAEQVVFGRVTNGAANDLEKVTQLARSMVFEYGMSEVVTSRTMRADNYALSEETKRLRDSEQALLTDHAFAEAVRLLTKHRASLDRVAAALLEKETLVRDEIEALLGEVPAESHSSELVGVTQVVRAPRPRGLEATEASASARGGPPARSSQGVAPSRSNRRAPSRSSFGFVRAALGGEPSACSSSVSASQNGISSSRKRAAAAANASTSPSSLPRNLRAWAVEHRRPLPAAEALDQDEKLLDLRRVAELERRLEPLDDPELHGQERDPESLAPRDGALRSLERSSRLALHPENHRLVHVESIEICTSSEDRASACASIRALASEMRPCQQSISVRWSINWRIYSDSR